MRHRYRRPFRRCSSEPAGDRLGDRDWVVLVECLHGQLGLRRFAAACQFRLGTPGRAYLRRMLAGGKTPMEAMRCLKRRISDAIYRQLVSDARAAAQATGETGPGGHSGRLMYPARPVSTRTPPIRISHFPDPHQRRYPRRPAPGRPRRKESSPPPLDKRGAERRHLPGLVRRCVR
jgi:hypothetical protein